MWLERFFLDVRFWRKRQRSSGQGSLSIFLAIAATPFSTNWRLSSSVLKTYLNPAETPGLPSLF